MMNGKLKSHKDLWKALLDAEKLFSGKDPQVCPVSPQDVHSSLKHTCVRSSGGVDMSLLFCTISLGF